MSKRSGVKIKTQDESLSGSENILNAFTKITNPPSDQLIVMDKFNTIHLNMEEFYVRLRQLGNLIGRPVLNTLSQELMETASKHVWPADWKETLTLIPDDKTSEYYKGIFIKLVDDVAFCFISGFIMQTAELDDLMFNKSEMPSGLYCYKHKVFTMPEELALCRKVLMNNMLTHIFDFSVTANNPAIMQHQAEVKAIPFDLLITDMPEAKQVACLRVIGHLIETARASIDTLFIPDIDPSIFENAVNRAINTPEFTNHPRLRDIAKECIHAGERFRERFPFYYRRYVIEGSTSVMFECYVADLVTIVQNKPHLRNHHESDYIELQSLILDKLKGKSVNPALKPFLDQITNTVQKKKAYFQAQEKIANLGKMSLQIKAAD